MKKMSKTELPEIPALTDEMLAQAFPGGFTIRDESNALTAFAFRNGPLETLHAGQPSSSTYDPSVSRITETEMKELMIAASEKLATMLKLRDTKSEQYRRFIRAYGFMYCRNWNRE
jgi:hypothetical protein